MNPQKLSGTMFIVNWQKGKEDNQDILAQQFKENIRKIKSPTMFANRNKLYNQKKF